MISWIAASQDFCDETSSSIARRSTLMLGRVLFHFLDLRRVAAGGLAHTRINRVTCLRKSARGQGAETARCSGDDDDVLHDVFSL